MKLSVFTGAVVINLTFLVLYIPPCTYSFCVGTLFINTWMSQITKNFTIRLGATRDVSKRMKDVADIARVQEPLLDGINPLPYAIKLIILFGIPKEAGGEAEVENRKDGIFNVLVAAYHSRLVEDKAFNESWWLGRQISASETYCRRWAYNVMYYALYNEKCFEYIERKLDHWSTVEADNTPLAEALLPAEKFDINITKFCPYHELISAATNIAKLPHVYNECLYATLQQIDVVADFDRHGVNMRRSLPNIPNGVINRMLKDTEESMLAVEENLKELEKRVKKARGPGGNAEDLHYWEEVQSNITTKLISHPLDQLYGGGTLVRNPAIIDDAREAWAGLKQATKDFRNYPYNEYRNKIESFMNDIDGPVEEWFIKLNIAYGTYLRVMPLVRDLNVDTVPDVIDNIEWKREIDQTWEFDLWMPLHKLRVGWDHLDRISEELKCHLRKTYYFDLRNETLQKTQSQFEKGQLFGHFSRTMYQTCRATDTDIVGRCNPTNHEICRPMVHSEKQEEHIQRTADMSIYRPKWIYWRTIPDPDRMGATCEGKRTFIIPLNICRCGFRLDCGKDLGVDIKCILHENDNFRKQCKGMIGYPCRSLPFAKGRHDESCVFGYCDMGRNSCEEDPNVYPIVHSVGRPEPTLDALA